MPYRQYGPAGTINAAGACRILRGLSAQGWTAGYMGELAGVPRRTIWRWMDGRNHGHEVEFVKTEVLETVERLREKLGAFDIAELNQPMDGMSCRAARSAAKNGWVVLADWDGLDIGDPRVTPHGADDLLEASNGLVLVDPTKIERALSFRSSDDDNRVVTVARLNLPLTKMELYEIIRVGSERAPSGDVRVSASLLAQRLGAAERTVQRYRAELVRADQVLDVAPPLAAAMLAAEAVLAATEWPAGFRLHAAQNLLAPYPIRRGFYRDLVILGATQTRPYGRGWDDTRLADWLGCTEQNAAALRAHAVLAGRQYYSFPTAGMAGHTRNLGTDLPAVAA